MIEIHINTSEVHRAIQAGEKLDLSIPMEASCAVLIEHLGSYSRVAGQPQRRQMTWKSARQRRGFFAALNRGEIRVPYRRTGHLGRSWSFRVQRDREETIGEIGNNVSDPRTGKRYGPYVMSHESQARIHRGIWDTDKSVVDQESQRIFGIFDRYIQGTIYRGR
jgi:hypothetical protein